jgi:vacuolar iron transporter family protein
MRRLRQIWGSVELALIDEAKGLPRAEAEEVAESLMADEQEALDAMVREELGLDPSTSAVLPTWPAAPHSCSWPWGRSSPLAPFLFGSGPRR